MSSKKNNFLVQGSILAIAGILTRVIGIIYRIPLNNILGDGISAYTIAYDIYSLFLLISSLSLPLAVSKIVASRMAVGQVKNAAKALKGAMAIAVAIGLTVSVCVYLFADKLAGLWKFPSASLALKILAPTLFIMCILGVLRGFFQGLGSMIPTAISQIFEQIVNAVVSVLGAYLMFRAGDGIGKTIEYSAAGGTMGTLAGAVAALVFVIFVYMVYRRNFNRMMRKDKTNITESYSDLGKVLVVTIFPVLLSTTIYNISSILDSAIYGNIMTKVFGFTESQYSPYWSIYSGHYRLLTMAPIAIASALSSAVVPSLIKSVTIGDYRLLKNKIGSSIKLTTIIAIPSGIGLSVLADPFITLLFGKGSLHSDDVLLMRLAVFVVIGYSFSTITNSILQGINKMKLPVIHSAIALGTHLFILAGLQLLKTDVYGVAIADILFSVTVCILNSVAINKHTGYRQEITKTFVLPLISAIIMGAGCFLVYTGMNRLIAVVSSSRLLTVAIPVVLAVIVAVLIYGVLLMLFKVLSEDEIKMFPAGGRLVRVLKRIRLL